MTDRQCTDGQSNNVRLPTYIVFLGSLITIYLCSLMVSNQSAASLSLSEKRIYFFFLFIHVGNFLSLPLLGSHFPVPSPQRCPRGGFLNNCHQSRLSFHPDLFWPYHIRSATKIHSSVPHTGMIHCVHHCKHGSFPYLLQVRSLQIHIRRPDCVHLGQASSLNFF